MQVNQSLFTTNSLNLSCFLSLKGHTLCAIEYPIHSSKAVFQFENTPEVQELVQVFYYATENDPVTLIDIRKVFTALKSVKEKLYQERNSRSSGHD